jgi:hypothetical protein
MKKQFVMFGLLLMILLPAFAFAQEIGSLTGTVTDQSGAVVSEVTVKLQDTKTGTKYETKTNSAGGYTFARVQPGPGYKLEFNKEGFESVSISDIYVAVGATHTQNAELRLGKVSESVEVSGVEQSVTLDTTDATIGNNFDMRNVHELPIQIRDSPAALLVLQPGVTSDDLTPDDPNSSRDGAVTGSRTDQGNITLDGLDVNDFATGQAFSTVANAPVDSIQEFRAETANPLAASGRGSGAQVQLVTKSGSNDWHGSLYEYHRNTITEANDFFNKQAGVERPKLIRNQFGASLGGPIIKDKLFFFFNYQGRRDAKEDTISTVVPLDSFRAGNIGYVNNGAGCDETSRINTQPNCISFINPSTVAGFDPQKVGDNAALFSFINGRYPSANDLTGGDGVNTGAFRFNAPIGLVANDYVARIDYNLTSKMKLFGRVSILRQDAGDDRNFPAPVQFPGDPITKEDNDHSYAYVFGHTWAISNTKVNQFFYGETRSDLNFPNPFNPTGVNFYSVFGPLTSPYFQQDTQHRVVPIPVFRDDFSYVKGKHNFQMGGTFKPIRTKSNQVNDFNFITLGLGGNLQNLDDSLRPGDILQDPNSVATGLYDQAFTFALGRFGDINSNFNNGRNLQPLPQGTGHTSEYRYYETEAYFQDSWRMRSDLTMTYGLRYQFYSVPYESNGLEAVPNLDAAQFFAPRAAQGPEGSLADLPLVSYTLGGKANHAAGLYKPDWKDFAPRLAFAYNPSADSGLWGHLLGNHKTVIRAGSGVVFDHPTTNALNFVQDQASYLFQTTSSTIFGSSDPNASASDSLATDPRFTGLGNIPATTPAPTVTVPFQPFVDNGVPVGAGEGQFNYAIDQNLKTPYSITYTLGFQRELPANFMFETAYFGRLGRRLLAQADAGQIVDFHDPVSGHNLAADFFDLSQQLRSGTDPTAVVAEPFFEGQFPGLTSIIAENFAGLTARGDLGDVLQQLDNFGLIAPGIGLHPQFGSNVYVTNKSYSSYNGLLTSLHRRLSKGLEFDVNYTFSHSIDNTSVPANNVLGTGNFAGALVCDITNLRACRGNSDFDLTHVVTGNFVYELPFGRGRQFGSTSSGLVNQIIGGWQVAGTFNWHTGYAFTTVSNAFPVSFANNAPAVFDGDRAAIAEHIHSDPATGVQLFADPDAARAAFRGPLGLEGGTRNNLRGPSFTNFDIGIAKHFAITEKIAMEFRADAFNAFNHVNFGLPGVSSGSLNGGTADISDPSSFGIITTAAPPREIQFALRLDF